MSDVDLDAIAQLIGTGDPVGAYTVLGLDRGGAPALLKRCAAVRIFDQELLDVLREALDPVPEAQLDDLIRAGAVEAVPGRPGYFRLPASRRREQFLRWWSDDGTTVDVPDDLRALSEAVLGHLAGRAGDELEVLFHELLVNPQAAVVRFELLYEEADHAGDLARCEDLLAVLNERSSTLGPDLARLWNDYKRRLRTREVWLDDWYRTARFLLPAASANAFEALLAGEDTRALVISGPPGSGKTSHVRWLIARRCAPMGIACARIDLTRVEPLVASREPWVFLLEIAAQLDPQLPESPFHELLMQYGHGPDLLSRGSGTVVPDGLGVAERDVFERLAVGLADTLASGRAVVVLDSIDDALLLGGGERGDSALAPLLDLLSRLIRRAPALRLVVAGRLTPAERLPRFDDLFPQSISLPLAPFTRSEARRYLANVRGISRPEIVELVTEHGERSPLELELIADLAERDPAIETAALEGAIAGTDLRHVLDRVLGSVDADLEPLLRLGVAARVLHRDFARYVLAPWLPVEHEADFDRLWRELKRYAASASWLFLDPVEYGVVRIGSSVLRPLRALLRQSADHDEVHERAVAFFEQRAAERPGERSRWLGEAIYHRFQVDGPSAERYWQRLLDQARIERHTERRRALAAEVLKPDYITEETPQARRDGRPLIRPATVVRARWELAVASVQLALTGGPEQRNAERLEAERALADLEFLQSREALSAAVGEAQLALVRSGIALGRSDLETAQREQELAFRGRVHPEDKLWLRLALAAGASKRGRRDASKLFKAALALAQQSPNPATDGAEVHLRTAMHHAEHDRLDRATAACRSAGKTARGHQAIEVRLMRAQIALQQGAPSEAIRLLARVPDHEPEIAARVSVMRVRALLAAARPKSAVAAAEAARARLRDAIERGDLSTQWLAAEGRELRGKARAALLDEEGAIRDLDWAATRWSRLGAGWGVCRCSVRVATLQLRGLGNFRGASARIDQARRTGAKRGGDAWTRCTLVGAELLARKGEDGRARDLIDDAIRELQHGAGQPRALVEAAIAGLAISERADADRYLELICEQLARVTPATARLAVLEGLDRCPRLRGASPELEARLRRLVPSPAAAPTAYAHLAERDRALLCLRDADLHRVLGRSGGARRALDEAQKGIPPSGWRVLLGPASRCGARSILAELGRREVAHPRQAETVLDGAVAVELAESLLDTSFGPKLLERAAKILVPHGALGGRWLARLEEVQAVNADRRGDELQMREHLAHAAELYDGLEDDRSRDAVLERITPGSPPRIPAVEAGELRVTLRLRDDALVLEAQAHGRLPSVRHDTGDSELVREVIESAPGAGGLAALPATVDRVLEDPAAVGRELAALLLGVVPDDTAGVDSPIDLGLRSKHTAVRSLPWELAVPELEPAGLRLWRRAPRARGEPDDIRGVQGALNRVDGAGLAEDGILGPLTRAALERAQRRLGLEATGSADPATVQRLHSELTGAGAPRVLIVRPTRRAEELTSRGSRQSGVVVEWMYERVGFSPHVLDAPTPDELREALHGRPVAVLHVTAGLVNHHGSAAVDLLAAPRTKGRSLAAGLLTGTSLDRVIPRGLPTPLLILDVTAPRSRREMVTQLLLRNAFVSELLAVGTTRAAVATGLAHYGRQRQLYTTLTETLAQGNDVGSIARRLREQGGARPDFERTLAFSATALFARTPHVRFPGVAPV